MGDWRLEGVGEVMMQIKNLHLSFGGSSTWHTATQPHLLIIPTETSMHRKEGGIAWDRKDSKRGEYMVQAPSGMEGAPSLWQNHLPRIRPLLSVQTGGNESSALFCTPMPTEVTGSEQERDGGESAETRALGIIAAWKLFSHVWPKQI